MKTKLKMIMLLLSRLNALYGSKWALYHKGAGYEVHDSDGMKIFGPSAKHELHEAIQRWANEQE